MQILSRQISLEFRLKKIDKTKNCLLDETNHNLILVTTITGFASVFVFAALVCVPVGLRVLK